MQRTASILPLPMKRAHVPRKEIMSYLKAKQQWWLNFSPLSARIDFVTRHTCNSICFFKTKFEKKTLKCTLTWISQLVCICFCHSTTFLRVIRKKNQLWILARRFVCWTRPASLEEKYLSKHRLLFNSTLLLTLSFKINMSESKILIWGLLGANRLRQTGFRLCLLLIVCSLVN